MKVIPFRKRQNNEECVRGKVLAYIQEASCYSNCLNPSMENNLLDRMTWIESELNLSSISLNRNEQEYYASLKIYVTGKDKSQLSDRQIHCFVHCMDLIKEVEYSKAYHELFDYIHDYGRKDGEPLSDFEVKGLKLLVEAMISGINAT